jgi:hypothetical protein
VGKKGHLGLDSKQIQEITAEGILYIDNDNNKKFIAFEDCFNTFLKWELSVSIITEKKAEFIRSMKQVGEISYIGENFEPWITESTSVNRPYVLFYDNQLTRFEFSEHNECAEFHQRVTETGWNLFDTSD